MVCIRGSYEILTEIPDLAGLKIIRLSGVEGARAGFSLPDSSAIAVFWLIERLHQVAKQIVELDPFGLEVKPEHRVKIEEEYLKIIAESEIVDFGAEKLLLFPVEFLTLCDFAKKTMSSPTKIIEGLEKDREVSSKQEWQMVFPPIWRDITQGGTGGENMYRCRRKFLRQQQKPADSSMGKSGKKVQIRKRCFVDLPLSTHQCRQFGCGMLVFILIFSAAMWLG